MNPHNALVERAVRWLNGTVRCNLVLSGIASTSEIPDAIGWSGSYKYRGSIVIECKTSLSDFHADKKKYRRYVRLTDASELADYINGGVRISNISERKAKQNGYAAIDIPRIGRYRYFMVPKELQIARILENCYEDHGLLLVDGRRVLKVREAPRRESCNLDAEIRLLQFALIHVKHNLLSHGCTVDMCELTKFAGLSGITFPEKERAFSAIAT